ncbi:hypothetical protein BJF86_13880 [Serinicoccus sp. CNJ-927]|nr:hypothetical protein BJF86_13880 [Serinicoccus sp. CNJ-927]
MLRIVLAISALLAVLVTAFAWPAVNSAPRDVPLGVVAPAPALAQLEGQLASGDEPAFELTSYDDRAAAEEAILGRDVYGAVVLGPGGGELLVASGASPAVATSLQQFAAAVPAEAGGPLTVTDLAPLPEDDPRGVGLATSLFPILLGGMASGIASALALRTPGARLAAVGSIAVVGGLVIAGILQGWLGALTGSWWANSGAIALGIGAIGASLVGLHRVLGLPGVGLGAAVMMLLGNPLSGVSGAPEMLPAGWGALGQLLPPGAAGSLLRSTAFFDGAGAWGPVLVLGTWLVVGAALALVPRREA